MHKRSLLCVRVRALFHYRWYQRRRHTRITPFPPPLHAISFASINLRLFIVELLLMMIHARGNLPSWDRGDNATNESFGSMISGRKWRLLIWIEIIDLVAENCSPRDCSSETYRAGGLQTASRRYGYRLTARDFVLPPRRGSGSTSLEPKDVVSQ